MHAALLKPMTLDPLPGRPLVSILVPSHNYAPYLEDAIQSALDQTYDNLEVVICDDGSTDGSIQIIEKYRLRDRRLKAIYQSNEGQALALNSAFRASAGEIICLLDADDVFLPCKLKYIVNAFAATPSAGFAVHRMLKVDKARKYLGTIPSFYRLPSGWKGPSWSLGPRTVGGLPPCSGLSMRRCVAEAIFPLPAGLKAYADMPIQALAPMLTHITAVQTPLSEYRVHGSNVAGVSRFTEDRLRNLVAYERELWRVWRRYLESTSLERDSDFQMPSEKTPTLMDYAYARFRSECGSKSVFWAIPPEHFRSLPRIYRWYWRTSVLLPNRLFRKSFNFVYGQTRAKTILGRVLNACRNGMWPRNRAVDFCAGR
jgi:glycosyltransferase involved in cell wall biosynthesis